MQGKFNVTPLIFSSSKLPLCHLGITDLLRPQTGYNIDIPCIWDKIKTI